MDAIDLSVVTILNSPDVRQWPATSHLSRLTLRPTGAHVEHSKEVDPNSWPDIPFGTEGGTLQYTLWILLQINGHWFTSGCIEYWRGCDENGGPVGDYAKNWYYDGNRWAPMTGHQPAVGEAVGFFVTSGDARNNGDPSVRERSQVVLVNFPDATGGDFAFTAAPHPAPVPVPPAPTPQPIPAPPPPVPPAPPASDVDERFMAAIDALVAAGDRILEGLTSTRDAINGLNAKIAELETKGISAHLRF